MHCFKIILLTINLLNFLQPANTICGLSAKRRLTDNPFCKVSMLYFSILYSRSYAFIRLEKARYRNNTSLHQLFPPHISSLVTYSGGRRWAESRSRYTWQRYSRLIFRCTWYTDLVWPIWKGIQGIRQSPRTHYIPQPSHHIPANIE